MCMSRRNSRKEEKRGKKRGWAKGIQGEEGGEEKKGEIRDLNSFFTFAQIVLNYAIPFCLRNNDKGTYNFFKYLISEHTRINFLVFFVRNKKV